MGRLNVDTTVGGNHQRYSFMETPLEMHPSSHQKDLSSPPPADQTTPPQHHAGEELPKERQRPWSYAPSEKEQFQNQGIIPDYANCPPLEQHPANYAPLSYTHIPDQQRGIEQPQQYTSYTEPPRSPPNSPGPLPVKVNLEAPTRSETLPIAPDENPLQSPKSPYFPPPTRATTSHAPQPDDLGAYHQPGQTTHPNQEIKGGGWSNGLCEFSNFGICCLGLLCPCILYGRTQHRLSMKSRKEDPTNMLGYETCNGSCTAMGLLCGCQWLLATVQHTRTRKTYGIQGSIASDCVRATCCTCCTLIQDEKEIQKREEYRSRAATERGATLLSPYTTPGPMSYGPPR
ncbi:Pc21g07920 [Penicillium rubens Wisconsin 54-1255]|uniref:Pc21g07920 protein n=1 Tax=Penicillium rubens (strain ATCC 28089 / DSM 1075 / NRRL 1951 / Wisconsin 54-1255) TaxID=500485 RepID=B6HL86_PENRW|nr:Pc21g07920 [Penicillium rubens Wisconsin 54-1255]